MVLYHCCTLWLIYRFNWVCQLWASRIRSQTHQMKRAAFLELRPKPSIGRTKERENRKGEKGERWGEGWGQQAAAAVMAMGSSRGVSNCYGDKARYSLSLPSFLVHFYFLFPTTNNQPLSGFLFSCPKLQIWNISVEMWNFFPKFQNLAEMVRILG